MKNKINCLKYQKQDPLSQWSPPFPQFQTDQIQRDHCTLVQKIEYIRLENATKTSAKIDKKVSNHKNYAKHDRLVKNN